MKKEMMDDVALRTQSVEGQAITLEGCRTFIKLCRILIASMVK
ncbi:MAG: hypothetical protein PHS82_13095 [Lachnospiraceae bacterium]|nr:hypothetical protein [Lachnospiraceae bacterium]